MQPTGARLPHLGRKDEHRQQEKYSHNFEEHDAAHAAKGAKESAHASACLRHNASGRLTGGSNLP